MTTFLLLRHAAHEWLGRGVAGRLPDVSLNEEGRAQAQALAEWLQASRIDAIYCSPQPRTRQTVAPLAARLGLEVEISSNLDEIDFGAWMGRTFEQLERDPGWDTWVNRRSMATPPGGEPFIDVQRRGLAELERAARLHPQQRVLLVSHGDVIKAVLAFYLAMSLDALERFDIAPVSVSVIEVGPGWSKVRLVNGVATPPPSP
jgi:broad specificity phosphatase PhoE